MLMLKKMGSELENHSAIVTQTAEVFGGFLLQAHRDSVAGFLVASHPTSSPEGWRVLNLTE
jgi:hypothetical protein